MAKSYRVRRTINAAPEPIWALLTNGPSWRDWNPTIVSFDGTIARGEKVRLVSTVNPKRAFTLTVDEVEAPRRMVWSDGMPLGLFKGVRTYDLRGAGDGTTEFTMEETYRGLLAPLITKAIPDMSDSFEAFADGLKSAAEGAA